MNTSQQEIVAVTGGTGLIGRALISRLRMAGHEAFALRRPYTAQSLEGVTTVINLAGENLSGGRWTPARKQLIMNSRIEVLASLRNLIESGSTKVKTLISASAVGYYGSVTSDRTFSEADPPGSDFLAMVCQEWEKSADRFTSLGIRVLKIRIGVVFSPEGGALPKMMIPLKFGISMPLGQGDQWIPWIDLDDLVGAMVHLLEQPDLTGVFNAVAPNPVTSRELMKFLAHRKHRLYVPFGVPAVMLRLLLGEMAVVTLKGSRISSDRLLSSGFFFNCPALADISDLP